MLIARGTSRENAAMMIAEQARDTLDTLANSQGRSGRHVATGVALTAGAVLLSWALARQNAPDAPKAQAQYDRLDKPGFAPPKAAFTAVWPPLYIALTLSGLRIWNAPASPARTRALALWSLVQGFNALWMGFGFKHLGGQMTASVASLGTSLAYAWQARKVDAPAAGMLAPYLGWVSFANVLSEELWRRNAPKPTLH
jgi:benzodiazapine receptor